MPDRRKTAVRLYRRGYSSIEIGRRFKVTGQSVRRWLKIAGVEMRSRVETARRFSYDHDAFAAESLEAAYYAGLLMADGNVRVDKRLFSLEVVEKDRELVDGLRKFLSYTGEVKLRERTCERGSVRRFAALRVTAPDLVEQLAWWGVYPRKTKVACVPIDVRGCELERPFLRGLFDGDGCFHVRKNGYLYASFAGTPMVVDAFRDWCWRTTRRVGSLSRRKPYFHVVQFGAGSAVAVGEALYDGDGPRLSRHIL